MLYLIKINKGTFNGLTLWEQIDPSGGWNAPKKVRDRENERERERELVGWLLGL
jgi:hypothetical protein